MTKDQMVAATQILFDTFDVSNKEGKLRTIYSFFSNEDPEVVRIACRRAAQEFDRFPKINQLGEVIRTTRASSQVKQSSSAYCQHCNGSGILSAKDQDGTYWSYRCNCINGSKYVNFPSWFGTTHVGKNLVTEPYAEIDRNPEIYEKGLKWMADHGIKIPESIKNKITARIYAAKGKPSENEECPF